MVWHSCILGVSCPVHTADADAIQLNSTLKFTQLSSLIGTVAWQHCRPLASDMVTTPFTWHNCQAASRRRRRCVLNSQLAHDDCRRVRSHRRQDATRLQRRINGSITIYTLLKLGQVNFYVATMMSERLLDLFHNEYKIFIPPQKLLYAPNTNFSLRPCSTSLLANLFRLVETVAS